MKRIIYSLVLMFAVGGFFTSCIDNAEPVGVQKMREAHAEYVKACAELQKAKIAIAAAEASRILAEADYQDALTADQVSQTKRDELMAELERAAKALENEKDEVALAQAQLAYDKALEAWKLQLAEEQLKHEATMENLQKNLEQAQQALADYRREVELAAAKGLTDAEKAAIDEASNNYALWTNKHADALKAYGQEYADQLKYKSEAFTAGFEDFKAYVNSAIESYNYEKQLLNNDIDFIKDLRDTEIKEWAAAVKELRNKIQGLEAEKAKACAAWELAKHTVEPEIAAEYDAQIEELDKEIADLQKKVDKAEPKAKKANSKATIDWADFNLVEGFVKGFFPTALDNKILADRPNGAKYLKVDGTKWSMDVPYAAMDTVLNKVEKTGADKYLGFNYIISECERPYRYADLLKATPEELAKMKELVDATADSLAVIYAIDRAIIEDFNADLTAGSDFLKKVEKELQGKYDEAIAALDEVYKLYTGSDKKIEKATLKYEAKAPNPDIGPAPKTSKEIQVKDRYVVPSSIWDNDSLLVISTIVDAYDKAAACVELVPHSYVVIDEKTLKPVERKVNMDELSVEGFLSAQISGPAVVAVDQSLYMTCVYYSQYDNKGYSVKWNNVSHKYDVDLTKALDYTEGGNMYCDVLKAIEARLEYDKTLVENAKNDIKFNVNNKNTWTKTNWQDLEACGGENAAVLFAYLEALEEYTKLGFDTAKAISNYSQFEAARSAGNLNFFDITSLDPTGIFFTSFNAVDKGDGYAQVNFTVSATDVYNKILTDYKWNKADFEKTLPFELYAAEQYGNLVTTSTVEQWEAFKALIAKFEKSYTDQKNYNDNELAAAIKAWKESDDYKTLAADKKAKEALEKAKKEAIEEVLDPLVEVVNNYSTEIGHLTTLADHLDAIYGQYSLVGTTDALVKELDEAIADLYDDVLDIDTKLVEAEGLLAAINDTNVYEMAEEYFKNRLDALAEDVDQAAMWADYYKNLLVSLLEKYITVAE